jgi:hypothetical protein
MFRRDWVLAVLLVALAGCSHTQPRGQVEEEPSPEEQDIKSVQTIGDVTMLGNFEPIQVSGVGLVIHLDSTGGGTPNSQFKQMLEDQLNKQGVKDVKGLLSSPNNAMVLVSMRIPPGIRRGDPADVEVVLPPNSQATSLRGGYLVECPLRNYENSSNLTRDPRKSNVLIPGHLLGKAHGPLLVGFGEGQEELRMRRGRIWQGGECLIDMPLFLYLNDGQRYASVANAVATRINAAFADDTKKREEERVRRLQVLDEVTTQINHKLTPGGMERDDMAHAVSPDVIQVKLPYEYRFNPDRYLLVVRNIPLRMTPDQAGKYRSRLDQMLLEPKSTVRAAIRLEALGKESVPALRKGMISNNALVRFASAEALAYLGCAAAVDELGRLAENYDCLRGGCLTALAGFNEALTQSRLVEMLASPKAQLRYGAFRALLSLNELNPEIRGEQVNDAFWLHRVAPDSPAMVHISTSKRAEIVLFGRTAELVPPFRIAAGPEFVVAADEGDTRCTISRFVREPSHKDQKQCSLKLDHVLRLMAEMGGQYPETVEMLRQLDRNRSLTCAVQVDALPTATPTIALAAAGGDVSQLKDDAEWREGVVSIQQELGIEPGHAIQPRRQVKGAE